VSNTEWAKRFRDYLGRIGDMDMAFEFGKTHEKWMRFFFGASWYEHSD
jgi:hypothetical protein